MFFVSDVFMSVRREWYLRGVKDRENAIVKLIEKQQKIYLSNMKVAQNFRRLYGWSCKTWNAGYGLVISKFYGVINLGLLISTYLMVKGFEISLTETIIIGVTGVGFIFLTGLFVVKFGLLKAEASSNFVENPQLFEMYERLKRIEEKLDGLK